VAGGLANVGKSAGNAAMSPLRKAASSIRESFASGGGGASGAATTASSAATKSTDGPPAWAKAMKRRQTVTHGVSVASHTLKSGDSHGGGAGPDITQKD
jgi:type IV secretion system protein TrbL